MTTELRQIFFSFGLAVCVFNVMSCADTPDDVQVPMADNTVYNGWMNSVGEAYGVSNWHSEDQGFLLAGESDAAITCSLSAPISMLEVRAEGDISENMWIVYEFVTSAPESLTSVVPVAQAAGWRVFPAEDQVLCQHPMCYPQNVMLQKYIPLTFNSRGIARPGNLVWYGSDGMSVLDAIDTAEGEGRFTFSLLKEGPGEVHIVRIDMHTML
jgi:hypothetical protein